ncbi:MAG: NHL repeat-containing protein [Stagnimonas sp.]|nr:NHL repeat-containing protein [Stagnimonas sp.]
MRPSLLAPARRWLPLLLSLTVGLAACGGGSSDDDDDDSIDFITAFGVLGQSNYTSGSANRGSTVSAAGLAQPLGSIASNGQLFYVADYGNHRVLGYNAIPSSLGAAADFVIGQTTATSNSPGTGATQLALPASVAVADGKMVVADAGNNRVLIWNTLPTGNTAPDVVLGQGDFTGSDPGTAADKLSFPIFAAIANNKLFVSDQNNNRVLIWNTVPTVSGTAADVVLGQQGFTTATPNDEEDGLNIPAGLWTDGFRLMVADSGNNRVMFYSQVPRVNGADATFVIGQTDFSRVTAGVGQTALRTPYGVASDGTRIYIADSGNNRVLKFDAFPIANAPSAVDVYGQDRDDFTARTANVDDEDEDSDSETANGPLSSPTGVTFFNGVLYVLDRNNHRVLFFPG